MEVTRKDAEEYIAELKEKFQAHPEKYHEFCSLLLKFMRKQMDYSTMVSRVVSLMEGHQESLLGLKKFLPKNCTLIDEMILCKKEVSRNEAVAADDFTLNLTGYLGTKENSLYEQMNLTTEENSSDRQIDLTLSLCGNFQGRKKSSMKQVTKNQVDVAHNLEESSVEKKLIKKVGWWDV